MATLNIQTVEQHIESAYIYFSTQGLQQNLPIGDLQIAESPFHFIRTLLAKPDKTEIQKAIETVKSYLSSSVEEDKKRRAEFVKDVLTQIAKKDDPQLQQLNSFNLFSSVFKVNFREFQETVFPLARYPDWLRQYLADISDCPPSDFVEGIRTLLVQYKTGRPEKYMEGIPPLVLATLIQDDTLLLELLEAGYHVDESDPQGYTAAHMAAILGRGSTLSLLQDHDADFSLTTNLHGSVDDFLFHRGITEHECRTHVDSLYSAAALLAMWQENLRPYDTPLYEQLDAIFSKTMDDNPELPIAEGTIRRLDSPLRGQKEAVASRNIKAGEFVVEYTGYVRLSGGGTYALQLTGKTTIDAGLRGSVARYINHGPPNCYWSTHFYEGVPRIVFFALRNLVKGEPIYINYGWEYFNKFDVRELAPSLLDEAIVRMTLEPSRIEEAFIEEEGSLDALLKQHERQEVYIYLYEFPNHLIDSVAQGKVQKAEALNFVYCMKIHAQERAYLPQGYHDKLVARLKALA